MTQYEILWKSEDFQFCVAAASSASRHATELVPIHSGPSKIHYSLNTVFKIFPINRTTASRKLHDHMILERQLLMNTVFI